MNQRELERRIWEMGDFSHSVKRARERGIFRRPYWDRFVKSTARGEAIPTKRRDIRDVLRSLNPWRRLLDWIRRMLGFTPKAASASPNPIRTARRQTQLRAPNSPLDQIQRTHSHMRHGQR